MITEEIDKQIRSDIADFLHVDIHQLDERDDLIIDFHVDSFEIMRLIVFLEEKYNIRYNMMQYHNLTTVSSIVEETIKLQQN